MKADRNPFIGFSFLFLGSVVTTIVYTAPSVIFEAVIADIGLSPQNGPLIQTLFIGCLGGSLAIAGSLGDEIGKKRLCLIGLAVMTAACVLAAVAPSGAVLLFARAVQGAGMAAFLSTMVALCSALFDDPKQKALAFSLFGASVGLAVTTATLIGEEVLEHAGWRALFLCVIPLLVVSWVGIARLVHEKAEYSGRVQFDGVGAALLGVGLLSLIFALAEGPAWGWFASRGLTALFLAAAVAFLLFHLHERRRRRMGRYVALDYTLFRIPSFASGTVTTGLYFSGALAVQQIWPSLMEAHVPEITAVDLGLLMAGMGTSFTLTSLAASSISRVLGVKRAVIAGIGSNLLCLGLVTWVIASDTPVSLSHLAAAMVAFGAGYGLVFTKITYLAVAGVDQARASSASGVLLSARQTSAAVGAAALAAVAQISSSLVVVNVAAGILVALALVSGAFLREPAEAKVHQKTRGGTSV